ncbi:DUF3553 domain-containing protein [Alphaproteobacteria bacterium]|jgi:hypothetical protein|nr:DUF3553 domain-containing protein [Alphaproteobacteria bacterium]
MEKNFIFSDFTPGTLVKCLSQPSWGIGQVQSCIGNKATINFENSGKKVIDLEVVNLEVIHSVS